MDVSRKSQAPHLKANGRIINGMAKEDRSMKINLHMKDFG